MPYTTIFDDNFSEYTPGSTNITSFFNLFGENTVIDFGTMTGSTSATGFYEYTGQGVNVSGTMVYQDASNVYPNLQITWEAFGGGRMTGVGNFNGTLGTGTNNVAPTFAGFVINPDYTASFYVTSTSSGGSIFGGTYLIANSDQQVIYPNCWQYYQAQYIFGTASASGLGNVLTIAGTLAVEGTQILSGTATTGILISSMYVPTPGQPAGPNQITFPGSTYLTNITGYIDTLPPFTTWPHPGSPEAFITQAAVEIAASSALDARVTQGVIELPIMPTLRYSRITQGVVEIIFRQTPSGGWMVYEI